MTQFSSKEGYKAFDDAIPTSQSSNPKYDFMHRFDIRSIVEHLHKRLGIRTAVVSNGDTRIRASTEGIP